MIFDVVSKANDSLDPKASFPHIYFAVTGHSLDYLLIDLDLNEWELIRKGYRMLGIDF